MVDVVVKRVKQYWAKMLRSFSLGSKVSPSDKFVRQKKNVFTERVEK